MLRRLTILSLLFLSMESWGADYIYRPDDGLTFSWKTDDAVGITTGTTNQLKFWASSKASATTNERELYAVGYKLKQNTAYYSYSPYKWGATFDATTIQCTYNGQNQDGNASTAGLATYDYQMAAATSTNNACMFVYRHIGSFIRLTFRAPRTMSIAELTLQAETAAIATTATMNLTSATVSLGEKASSFTLTTNNITVTEGEGVALYLTLPAQDLTASELDIVIGDASGTKTRLARIKGMMLKAGMLYEIPLADVQAQSHARQLKQTITTDGSRASTDGISNPKVQSANITIDPDYQMEAITLPDDGTITEIKETKHNNENDTYYNLGGIITKPHGRKSLYIHKGKKIIR